MTYPPQQPYVPYPRNDLAVWSLVLGIVSLVTGCLLIAGIPAIVLGNKAKAAVAAGEADNPQLATVGIVLGWVAVALSVLGFLALILLLGVIPLLAAGVGATA